MSADMQLLYVPTLAVRPREQKRDLGSAVQWWGRPRLRLVLNFSASIVALQQQRKQLSVPHLGQLIHGRPPHRRLHVVDDRLLRRVVERSIGDGVVDVEEPCYSKDEKMNS
jgi:hypothetical protein